MVVEDHAELRGQDAPIGGAERRSAGEATIHRSLGTGASKAFVGPLKSRPALMLRRSSPLVFRNGTTELSEGSPARGPASAGRAPRAPCPGLLETGDAYDPQTGFLVDRVFALGR